MTQTLLDNPTVQHSIVHNSNSPNVLGSAVDYEASRRISVAPMMEWTDRHCRAFLRQITKHSLLYTEMVHCGAIVHGNRQRFLDFDACEHPLALQLGGSDTNMLAEAAKIAEQWGYDEINLNVGCPSERVQRGAFGACLMAEPDLVADCVAAMRNVVKVPVTVKCRIGIDDFDQYEFLTAFIDKVSAAGCEQFTIHARKAILKGLSPKENREIPPLNYERVYQLKRDYPDLHIVLNGGVTDLDTAQQCLDNGADGVMIGRAAYQTPFMLAEVDKRFFGANHVPTRTEILAGYADYIQPHLDSGLRLHRMTRHVLGLCRGIPGANRWRRHLSENANHPESGIEVLHAANAMVDLTA